MQIIQICTFASAASKGIIRIVYDNNMLETYDRGDIDYVDYVLNHNFTRSKNGKTKIRFEPHPFNFTENVYYSCTISLFIFSNHGVSRYFLRIRKTIDLYMSLCFITSFNKI